MNGHINPQGGPFWFKWLKTKVIWIVYKFVSGCVFGHEYAVIRGLGALLFESILNTTMFPAKTIFYQKIFLGIFVWFKGRLLQLCYSQNKKRYSFEKSGLEALSLRWNNIKWSMKEKKIFPSIFISTLCALKCCNMFSAVHKQINDTVLKTGVREHFDCNIILVKYARKEKSCYMANVLLLFWRWSDMSLVHHVVGLLCHLSGMSLVWHVI